MVDFGLVAETLHAAHSSHRNHYALMATLAESGPTSQAELLAPLDEADRATLVSLLKRIAAHHGGAG